LFYRFLWYYFRLQTLIKKKNICCQTYLNYKSTCTVKSMTEWLQLVTLISFISRAYGSKASDEGMMIYLIYLHKVFKYSQKLWIWCRFIINIRRANLIAFKITSCVSTEPHPRALRKDSHAPSETRASDIIASGSVQKIN